MVTFVSPTDVAAATLIRSATINDLDAAVVNMAAVIPTENNLQRGTTNYAVDTGIVNAYVVALPHTPSGYVDGLLVSFRALNTNTGASTINVSGLGVKSIRTNDLLALTAGDIAVGAPMDIRYSSATGFFHLARGAVGPAGSVTSVNGITGAVTVQALDATLTALAGLATGADKLPYSTGTDVFAETTFTAFARTLLDDANAAAGRSTLAAASLVANTFTGQQTSTAGDINLKTVTALSNADATLSAAELITGLFTITPTVARTLTTDTAANIIAAMGGYAVGSHFEFTIVNTAAFNVTLAAGVGVTLSGKAIVNNGSGTWRLRVDSASAVTIFTESAVVPDPVMTATVGGLVPTPPNNTTTYLRGDGVFGTPAYPATGNHAVIVTTGNGYGSATIKIRRYTTTQSSVGTHVVYADSATLGATFTIAAGGDGIYAIYVKDHYSGAGTYIGASLNSAELTTDIESITAANRLLSLQTSASAAGGIARSVRLVAGDIIRPHHGATLPDTTAAARSVFAIIKVGL